MAQRRDQDRTVRISIVPDADGGGVTVSTAYQAWRVVEPLEGSRQDLIDAVLRGLNTVMPGEPEDAIRFVSLDPSDS